MEIKSDSINSCVFENVAFFKSELIFMGVQKLDCDDLSKREVLKEILDLLDSFSNI